MTVPSKAEKQVVVPGAPDLETAREAWDAAEREQDFWRQHYGELLKQYPDQFVAVLDGQVVAASADLQRILKTLKQQGIDLTGVWLEFLGTNPRLLRL